MILEHAAQKVSDVLPLFWFYSLTYTESSLALHLRLFAFWQLFPPVTTVGREACNLLAASEGNKGFSQACSLALRACVCVRACMGLDDLCSSPLSSYELQIPKWPPCSVWAWPWGVSWCKCVCWCDQREIVCPMSRSVPLTMSLESNLHYFNLLKFSGFYSECLKFPPVFPSCHPAVC